MTTQIKAKLLQHFAAKKSNKGGFTLIELLVVIIIIGILSAIALPSFLNQANKAKQSEAKTYVGSMNRAQQAFYLERGSLSAGLDTLGLGIPAQTDNYDYSITQAAAPTVAATQNAAPRTTDDDGNAVVPSVKAYQGAVFVSSDANGDSNSIAELCEAKKSKAADSTAAADTTEAPTYTAADSTTTPPTPASIACDTKYEPV